MITEKEIDWFKLDAYKNLWIREITEMLPKDSNFLVDEIGVEIDDCFIYRIRHYRPALNGCSLESYIYSCKHYIVKEVYIRLMKEYSRIKNQIELDYTEDDDSVVHKKISPRCYVDRNQDTIKSAEDKLDGKMKIQMMTRLYETALKMDRESEGYYDYAYLVDLAKQGISQQDIAEEIGTTQKEISRRLSRLKERVLKESI